MEKETPAMTVVFATTSVVVVVLSTVCIKEAKVYEYKSLYTLFVSKVISRLSEKHSLENNFPIIFSVYESYVIEFNDYSFFQLEINE